MSTMKHILDTNGLYALDLTVENGSLHVSMTDNGQPWPRFKHAVLKGLSVQGSKDPIEQADGSLLFSPVPGIFDLRLHDQPIGTYLFSNGAVQQTRHRPLTVSETRRIGTFHEMGPYPQPDAALAQSAQKSIFTDFHTHSSGQISAKGLVEVGIKHDAFYPLHLLQEADIDTARFTNRKTIPRVKFPPLEPQNLPDQVEAVPLAELSAEERGKLEQKMSVPADKQSTYTEMEYDAYRFRYPLTKNKELFVDTWKQVAREYVQQGISWAELAMVGLDDPDQFVALHQAMHEIEKDPELSKVKMRFMVGIPRNWSNEKIKDTLDKTKIISESPYITGVDFIGYEVNKTETFKKELHDFSKWMNKHRPGFTLRVHAGENDKNLENVSEFLQLVKEFPKLRARIGHGIYGMNEKTLKLAESMNDRLVFEFNPASNIALNNLDDLTSLPFASTMKHHIPFIIGSDSAGVYQTDAAQLGLDTYYAGLDANGFHKLNSYQTGLVVRQSDYTHALAKKAGWPEDHDHFLEKMVSRIRAVPPIKPTKNGESDHAEIAAKLRQDGVTMTEPGKLPHELQGLTPITVIGASGSSWKRVAPGHRRESAIMIDMLAHALNPDKTYFVHGRTKKEGLSQVVINSIQHGNAKGAEPDKGRRPFYSLGLLAEPRFDVSENYSHLNFMERIPGTRLDLADALVKHTIDHQGMILGIGGAAFTRDIILKADQRGMLDDDPNNKKMMLLYSGAKGAAAEKAARLDPRYKVDDAKATICALFKQRPDLFNTDFDINKLHGPNGYYEKSAERIEKFQYDQPPTNGHRVTDIVKLGQEHDRSPK